MTVRPRRIGHVGMVARDLARMVAFYEDTLGMQVSDRMPYPEDSPYHEAVWMRINADHHVISMFGLRESTWELRLITGALFGLAAIWYALPLVQKTLEEERVYALQFRQR